MHSKGTLAFYEVVIMVLFNVQHSEPGKVSKGVNRPGELVVVQESAFNGSLVCVESDEVPLRENVGFLVVYNQSVHSKGTLTFYEVVILVLFNVQVHELGKCSKGGNRPGELVVVQTSACNGNLVCVESDEVPLCENVGFLVTHYF